MNNDYTWYNICNAWILDIRIIRLFDETETHNYLVYTSLYKSLLNFMNMSLLSNPYIHYKEFLEGLL